MDKLSSAVAKKLKGKKTNSHNNSGGESFEQLVKDATQKHLKAPDSVLNQKVIELVPATVNSEGATAVGNILTERLSQKNPHKVYLAICLIKEVLRRCQGDLGDAKESIMAEVGKVAGAPMNRFDDNLSDQQRTKHAAFEMLKTYGQDGHVLSQPTYNRASGRPSGQGQRAQGVHGGEGGQQSFQSLPDLLETIETQTVVADSHNDLLQDMLLDKSSYESKSPQDRALAKDVIMDATKFGQQFEQQLGRLSAYDSPEAVAAMTRALEKMDILNNSLNLHKEMLQKQLKGAMARPQRGTPPSPRRTTPPAAASPPAPPQQPALGGLLELQQGMEAPYQQSQPAAHDPFAASTQWNAPGSQQPYQQPPSQHARQQSQQLQPQGSFSSAGSWSMPGQQGGYGGYGPGYPNGQGFPQPQQNPPYNPYPQGYGGQHAGYPQGPQAWGGPPSSHPQGYYPPGPQGWGGPPSSQGYGHQGWGGPQGSGPGYGPPQGYGFANFGPPGQPRPQESGYGQRPPSSQQYPPLSQQGSQHVPPPMLEATVYVPAKSQPSQSANPFQKADSLEQPSKPAPVTAVDSGATSPARPQTPSSTPDTFSKASPLPSPSPDQPAAPQATPAADEFSFESNAFEKPQTFPPITNPSAGSKAPPPSPVRPAASPAADEFAFESSAFGTPAPPPAAATPTPAASSSAFQLKPEPARGPAPAFEAFPRPPTTTATAQTKPPAVAKQDDDFLDLFFPEQKGGDAVKQAAAAPPKEKKPVDLLADAFKEMESKQKA